MSPTVPQIGGTVGRVAANKGLMHTVIPLAHTRININGVAFPGANTLDDCGPYEIYEYQKHIDDPNVPAHRFAADKGWLTIDYTGHCDMFKLPNVLVGEGVQNAGKFISWICRAGSGYTTNFADAFIFNESSVILKFEGKGMMMTKYF